jgi:hypothetical protein
VGLGPVVPLNSPPPTRTKFPEPESKTKTTGSGIAWPWLKFFQDLYSFVHGLTFANIGGQIAQGQAAPVLTGTQAAIPVLTLGQFYFATDTGNVFFGTPGFGPGHVQLT